MAEWKALKIEEKEEELRDEFGWEIHSFSVEN